MFILTTHTHFYLPVCRLTAALHMFKLAHFIYQLVGLKQKKHLIVNFILFQLVVPLHRSHGVHQQLCQPCHLRR